MVGEALRRERLRSGLTLEEAANDLGVSVQVLMEWESGETEMRGADVVLACRYYRCSPDYLLGLVGECGACGRGIDSFMAPLRKRVTDS